MIGKKYLYYLLREYIENIIEKQRIKKQYNNIIIQMILNYLLLDTQKKNI